MTERSTDISLENLLIRGKFGKAELLARKFGKDLDLVWKAKLKAKYAELLSSQSAENMESIFQEITNTLVLVRDPEFVCGFCTKTGFPKLEWVKELLGIGIKKATQCSGTKNGMLLLQKRKTLYTFDQVLPTSGIDKWNEFSNDNTTMFAQCLLFLENVSFVSANEFTFLRFTFETV